MNIPLSIPWFLACLALSALAGGVASAMINRWRRRNPDNDRQFD